MNRKTPIVRDSSNSHIFLKGSSPEWKPNMLPYLTDQSPNVSTLSIENRMSSCEQGLKFLIEETVRIKRSMNSQLRTINEERDNSIKESNFLKSQLLNTQSQIAALVYQDHRTNLMENEWDRLRNSSNEISNITHLEQSLSKVLVEVRELGLRLNQYNQLYENQKESSSKRIQQNEFAIKKLENSFAQASSLLSKSEERITTQLRDITNNCSQDHHSIRSSIVSRFDKTQEDISSLNQNFQIEITQLNQTLSNLGENLKEVLHTTSSKINQLQHLDSKERESLENRIQSLIANIRDELNSKLEKLDQKLSQQIHTLQDSDNRVSNYLLELQKSSNILEKEIEINKQQIDIVLKSEIVDRKKADTEIAETFHRTHADLVKLVNGAHQANRVTEAKLIKHQFEAEASIDALNQSIGECHAKFLESVDRISLLNELVANETSSSEAVETLKKSYEKFKSEYKENSNTLHHQIESMIASQTNIKSEINLLSNKLLLAKENYLKNNEQTKVDLSQVRDSITQLENVIQPLLILPIVASDLSNTVQEIQSKVHIDEEEMIQIYLSLTQLEKQIDEKLRLESIARISGLTNVYDKLHSFQPNLSVQNWPLSPSNPDIFISQSSFQDSEKEQVPLHQEHTKGYPITLNPQQINQTVLSSPPLRRSRPNSLTRLSFQTKMAPTAEETPMLKPSSLHIPNLSVQSSSDTYYTSSVSLPHTIQTTTASGNSFSKISTTSIDHSTPYGYSSDKTSFNRNLYYSTSPIIGEMRVESSVRSQNTEDLGSKGGIQGSKSSSSEDDSPDSIAHKFEAIPEEDEDLSPNDDSTELVFPERLLSVIREESETNSFNTEVSIDVIKSVNNVINNWAEKTIKSETDELQQTSFSIAKEKTDNNTFSDAEDKLRTNLIDNTTDLQSEITTIISIPQIDRVNLQEDSILPQIDQSSYPESESNLQTISQPIEGQGSKFPKHLSNNTSQLIFFTQDSVNSLPGEHSQREFKRMRTVDSVARQSFVNPFETLTSIDDNVGINEWGVYQAVFWLKLKNRFMKPVNRWRETKASLTIMESTH